MFSWCLIYSATFFTVPSSLHNPALYFQNNELIHQLFHVPKNIIPRSIGDDIKNHFWGCGLRCKTVWELRYAVCSAGRLEWLWSFSWYSNWETGFHVRGGSEWVQIFEMWMNLTCKITFFLSLSLLFLFSPFRARFSLISWSFSVISYTDRKHSFRHEEIINFHIIFLITLTVLCEKRCLL